MEQEELESQANLAKYHHVALWKFLLLSLCTFGLYEIYWFYKSWVYVRERDHSDIQPFWRAWFAPIWFYSLAEDIAGEKTARRSFPLSGFLAFIYFLLIAAWRLPEPYWLISLMSVFAVLPLVRDVDSINRVGGVVAESYSCYTLKHIAVTFLGLSLLTFFLVVTIGVIPNPQVLSGRQLPRHVVSMLKDKELLEDNEEVIFFYSTAIFSYSKNGNYFTKNRVVRYKQEGKYFYVEQAMYEEIEEILVKYSDSWLSDTEVFFIRPDGTGFILPVTTLDDKDHLFVDSVKQLWMDSK